MGKILLNHWSNLFIIAAFQCFVACKASPVEEAATLKTGDAAIIFVDSLAATSLIVKDEKEGFFDRIQSLDISIQLKEIEEDSIPRATYLAHYQQSLQQQLSSFSEEEKHLLQEVFQQVETYLEPFTQFYLPDSILLLKVKGDHYGPSTYYTRENSIIIPQAELDRKKVPALTRVMLHELFHIYSRYELNARQTLYELIGFTRLSDTIILPDSLARQLLLNPDGIDWRYAIQLKSEFGDAILAVPLIVSANNNYITGLSGYFDYIDFQLYPLEEGEEAYHVAPSPLPAVDQFPDFFQQIGDNTNYIIHPDEILADNFVLLALALSGDLDYAVSKYSKRGQEILEGIEEVVK